MGDLVFVFALGGFSTCLVLFPVFEFVSMVFHLFD